ncbi:hypothetical protein CDD83_3717 [Cordyceps sp. RAO-2017]|nr:hypothetical protein CDD83_3717 [Cordyceps sp. RAO-2017]
MMTSTPATLPKFFSLPVCDSKSIPVPSVGYGTISEDPPRLPQLVCEALRAGVRHLDCAWEYGVSWEVGEGIRRSGVPRADIFVTTKIHSHFYHPDHIPLCVDQMLREMRLEYVDLLLLHLPVALKPTADVASAVCAPGASFAERRIEVTTEQLFVVDAEHSCRDIASANRSSSGGILATWAAMKDEVRSGRARAIGVSNFCIPQLREILDGDEKDRLDMKIPLSANQIEVHPFAPNRALVDFMKRRSIQPMAHSPFASSRWLYSPGEGNWYTEPLVPRGRAAMLLDDPVIREIAVKHSMSPGQVVQSWLVQQGIIPLGRSTRLDRLRANLDVRPLDAADFARIAALECPEPEGRCLLLRNTFPGINFIRDLHDTE